MPSSTDNEQPSSLVRAAMSDCDCPVEAVTINVVTHTRECSQIKAARRLRAHIAAEYPGETE